VYNIKRKERVLMNRIKQLRTSIGLNQAELADKLRVARSMISKYENEQTPLSDDVIRQLTVLFKVSSDYLLCLTDSDVVNSHNSIGSVSGGTFVQGINRGTLVGTDSKPEKPKSPEVAELLRIFDGLNVLQRMEILTKAFAFEKENKDNGGIV
jgi:transcriptional regulator with XRE-family HTH domain